LSYLLDTNVLSELRRKNPDKGVVEWFTNRPASTLFLSVLTLGELRKGIEKIQDPIRSTALTDWLETDLPNFFTGRILSINSEVADTWGRLTAMHTRPLPAIDSLLGATAAKHGLSMVTRNARDFEGLGIDVINPWTMLDGSPVA
jgi:predicted nucleic acid-binding protein